MWRCDTLHTPPLINSSDPTTSRPPPSPPLLQVEVPDEFQGAVVGGLNRRKGLIKSVQTREGGGYAVAKAVVPLSQMFGYSTDLRSSTEGKGEYAMDYLEHAPMMRDEMETVAAAYQKKLAAERAAK